MAMLEVIQGENIVSIKKEGIYSVEVFFIDEWEVRIAYGLDDSFFIRCGVAPCSKEYAYKIYREILQSLKLEHDTSITTARPVGE
jgi:hypothetical protein